MLQLISYLEIRRKMKPQSVLHFSIRSNHATFYKHILKYAMIWPSIAISS